MEYIPDNYDQYVQHEETETLKSYRADEQYYENMEDEEE